MRIHLGDLFVHDLGILHANAQTISGKTYLIVAYVHFKSWKSMCRHFGMTATCVNITTVNNRKFRRISSAKIKFNIDRRCRQSEKNDDEYDEEIVCPGVRTATRISIQYYTTGFVNSDMDDPTSIPTPLVVCGVYLSSFKFCIYSSTKYSRT
jgi:hypothetical protein